MGCSMGASILANLVGHQGSNCFLDAVCMVQAPIKLWECAPVIEKSFFGLYDSALGSSLNGIL